MSSLEGDSSSDESNTDGIDEFDLKNAAAEIVEKKSKRFRPKKSKVLTASQINQFLLTAPDDTYLTTKVNTNSEFIQNFIYFILYLINLIFL